MAAASLAVRSRHRDGAHDHQPRDNVTR
jgi:hypothetical protein